MEHSSSWEAANRSAGQEIPFLLSAQTIHYRIQKSPLMDPLLSHFNPV
jgi:hypothetical protein